MNKKFEKQFLVTIKDDDVMADCEDIQNYILDSFQYDIVEVEEVSKQ